jgi:hypothetical protein
MARGSNALWAQLLRQKYLKNKSIWEVEVNPTSSWVFRSILSVRELAHGCIRHQIGNGKGTKLWTDPWLPEGRVVSVYRRDPLGAFLEGDCRVEKLINQRNTFRLPPPITCEIKHALDNIKEVELPAEGTEDKVIWNKTPTREYTLKSDWNAIRKTMPRVGWNKLLWHRQVIPRYASCVWKESPSQETVHPRDVTEERFPLSLYMRVM